MKKYNIFLFLSIVASLFFISCSNELNLQSDGRIDLAAVFTDRYETMGYLNSCYGYLPGPYIDRASYCDEAEDCDDNIPGARSDWYNGTTTALTYASDSQDGSPWTSLYEGIRKCNVFLANIWTSTAYATNEEKEGWAAQAHTLRALYYLQLIKRYGAVPLIDKPLAINHDYSKDTKSKFSAVVTFILADCDSALTAPATQYGFPWGIYTNQYGIMSRAVPYAIESEAVTYAASPLWADGTYSWADALAINKEALYQCVSNGGYSLFNVQPTNHAAQNAYALYFITSSNDQRSVDNETIYQGGGQMAIWEYAGMPTNTGMNKSGPNPTQELVDSYEMANGQVPITGYSDADHLQPIINTASGYDPTNPYANRDPRFYASIYYNGALRNLNPGTAGMEFTATAPFYGIEALCPSWSDNIGNLTFTLYQWNTNYATSVAGTPLGQKTFVNYNDGSNLGLSFSTPLPAGKYVWELSNGTQVVGVWKWTNGTSTAVSYFTGVQTTGNYRSSIAYAPNNYTSLVSGASTQTPVQIVPGRVVQSYVGGADGISATDRTHTRTGYYIAKFNNYQSGQNNNADGAIRVFRLAELYLNFAESAYQAGGPDAEVTLGSGMTMSARDAVDAIRARAGMPNLPSGMSQADFETRYRNERRVELAFESQRFFDVRRWKILSQTDQFVTGMQVIPNGSSYTYTRFKFPNRNDSSDKWLLYPLDQSEVNIMQGYTGVNWQNTGW